MARALPSAMGEALDIVIVNWNSGPLLQDCLTALAASSVAANLHVVVVDNASRDRSAAALDAAGLNVEVIRNADNRGFAAACNQGAARGRAPAILFLNPDTRVEPDTLARALRFMQADANPDVGVVGVRLKDEAGATQRNCARRPTISCLLAQSAFLDRLAPKLFPPHFMVEWDHEETRAVDQVMGAFLLIRRALFEGLGGFDERFFVYYEDLDLCVRAADAGWMIVHFAGASAWHLGGGTTAQVKDRRLFYRLRSQVQYAAKHAGPAAAGLLLLSLLAVNLPIRAVHAVLRRSARDGLQVLRGAAMLCADLPRLLPQLFRAA